MTLTKIIVHITLYPYIVHTQRVLQPTLNIQQSSKNQGCNRFVNSCYFSPLLDCLALEVEFHAIILGVNFSWELGWRCLSIELDSSYMVFLFNNKSFSMPWNLQACYPLCLICLSMTHCISHIFKEGNSIAKKFASFWLLAFQDFCWHLAPDFITHIMYRDMIELPYYRFN